MMQRWMMTGAIVFAAMLGELALPVWFKNASVLPSGLDLILLCVCLWWTKAECVFWAGLIGLLQDDVWNQPVGSGIAICATLGLIAQFFHSEDRRSRSMIDQALLSVVLLSVLGASRVGLGLLSESQLNATELVMAQAGRQAATFLGLFVLMAVSEIWSYSLLRNAPFREYRA